MTKEQRETLRNVIHAFTGKVLSLAETHSDPREFIRELQRGLERSLENIPRRIL